MKADELVTKEDLRAFRQELLNDLIAPAPGKQEFSGEWLRSSEVKKRFKISPGILHGLP